MSRMQAQVTMKSLERMLTNEKIPEEKFDMRKSKGQIFLSLELRENDSTDNGDKMIELDVTDYADIDIKHLIDQYKAYLNFGFEKP